MSGSNGRTIVVTGATGLQGGAVTRRLLAAGWAVRALTRNAGSKQAQSLRALGAEVVQGDMEDVAALRSALEGAYGVYSVQNPYLGGPDAAVRQGKHVADAARALGVAHLVYGSAGTGQPGTNIPSWETKLQVEAYMRALGLPLTILRPMAFMELMTHKKFFPAIGAWGLMPALMGTSRPLPWLCTEDLGAVAAKVFAAPQAFAGKELTLASDVRTLDECRSIYRAVLGKNPPRIPMPRWLFKHFGVAGKDLTAMWQWLRTGTVDLDTGPTRSLHPEALSVQEWLQLQKSVGT